MLDVHPPEHAAHSWRDFFIHIATIVVGLLIAIGLEQIVERVHEHYQLRELRENLDAEREANKALLTQDERDWRVTYAELRNDLIVLQFVKQHPGTPQTALPGVLRWTQFPFAWKHAVWDAAQQRGLVQLLPLEEANRYQEYYQILSGASVQSLQTWEAINAAHKFDLLDDDPTHLSPQRLDEVTQGTLDALQKHFVQGDSFGLLANRFPELPHTLTWSSVGSLRPRAEFTDPVGMAAAKKMTQDRLDAAEHLTSVTK